MLICKKSRISIFFSASYLVSIQTRICITTCGSRVCFGRELSSDCVSDVGFAHPIRVVRTMQYENQASTYDAGNVHPNCSNLALAPGRLGNSPNAITYVGSVFKLIITSDYFGTSMLYEPSLTSCTVYWRTTLLEPGPIISC